MVQVVGYLAETIIELTPNEASTLALAAAQAAHAMDDLRYPERYPEGWKNHG